MIDYNNEELQGQQTFSGATNKAIKKDHFFKKLFRRLTKLPKRTTQSLNLYGILHKSNSVLQNSMEQVHYFTSKTVNTHLKQLALLVKKVNDTTDQDKSSIQKTVFVMMNIFHETGTTCPKDIAQRLEYLSQEELGNTTDFNNLMLDCIKQLLSHLESRFPKNVVDVLEEFSPSLKTINPPEPSVR